MLAAKTLAVLLAVFSEAAEGLRRKSNRHEGAHDSIGDTCGVKGLTNSSEASLVQTGDSIIGGERVGECEWPWLVRLRHNSLSTTSCSAVLISPKLVLTVKNCLSGDRATYEVVAGNRNLELPSSTQQKRKSSKWYLHSADTEFAIFEVEEPFEMTDCVRPICVASSGADLAPGTSCMMAGCGVAHEFGWEPIFWQHAQATVVSADECESTKMSSERICAYGLGTGRRGHKDQGGPLFCEHQGRWTVFGVSPKEVYNFNEETNEKDFNTWLSVPQVSDWIASVVALTQ